MSTSSTREDSVAPTSEVVSQTAKDVLVVDLHPVDVHEHPKVRHTLAILDLTKNDRTDT